MSKMTQRLLVGLVAFTAAVSVSQASRGERFQLQKGGIKLDIPKHWQDVSDLFGVPLMVLGPEHDGTRPVISVVATGLLAKGFDDLAMKKEFIDYKQGREDWIKRRGGTLVSFNDYTTEKFSDGIEARSVGVRYKLEDDTEYAEKSYYVVCKNKFFHLKSIVRGSDEKEFGGTVEKTIKSFSCE
jgi:hypothetical protein